MPTFHHWRAGKQRNGLTFQTAADARAFDKGIIRAYDELIDGLYPINMAWPCILLTLFDYNVVYKFHMESVNPIVLLWLFVCFRFKSG